MSAPARAVTMAPPPAPAGGCATSPPSTRAIVIAHMGLGMLGLLLFAAALLWRAHDARAPAFQPLLLGLAHVLVLGWLLPTAIGALHRLAPLLLGAAVPSERASWWAFGLYIVGASGVTGHLSLLATGSGLPMSAVILAAAILLYACNFGAALVHGRPRGGVPAAFVGAALAWLCVTAILGATLAWNLYSPFLLRDHTLWLKGHAHAGALGFFGLLVMGAALRLLEMFLVSRGAPLGRARWAWATTNAGVVALVLGFTGAGPEGLVRVGAVLSVAGVVFFLAQARAIHARRIARGLDHGLRHTAGSFAWLAVAAVAGSALTLGLAPEGWRATLETAYASLALLGFVGGVVIGHLYKMLPMILAPTRQPRLVSLGGAGGKADASRPGAGPRLLQLAAMHGAILTLSLGLAIDIAPLRVAGAALFALATVLFARDVLGFAMGREPRLTL